jgi:hypothetical protein
MDVFKLKDSLITNYASYIRSFINIRDNTIKQKVDNYLDEGNLRPEALIQLNPAFESGGYIDELVMQGLLHAECSNIFRINKKERPPGDIIRLHRHQLDAIKAARAEPEFWR